METNRERVRRFMRENRDTAFNMKSISQHTGVHRVSISDILLALRDQYQVEKITCDGRKLWRWRITERDPLFTKFMSTAINRVPAGRFELTRGYHAATR